MRDPRGELRLIGDQAIRDLHAPLPANDFLRSELSQRLASDGLLVKFEIVDDRTLHSPRLPFVTFPHEWCDAQVYDAAKLTLDLQSEAVKAGFDLKDASAWNVLFDGAQPLFCDLLSFEALVHKPWWAAGQFVRHFLLPLVLADKRDFRASHTFRIWRDGIPPPAARSMLGPSRFLTRYWPLMASAESAARPLAAPDVEPVEALLRHRQSLHASLQWMLNGAKPSNSGDVTTWADYERRRGHYADESIQAKRVQVNDWLTRIAPRWVADFGCNAGEFSMIARACNARVVALDADHGAVQRLYRRLEDRQGVYPVLACLDDIEAGRGWAGLEVPGLMSRLAGRIDVVMMLALIHHLAIGAAVRLPAIAQFAHDCTRKWAIVEWLGNDDPLLRRLCEERRREPSEFSIERQRQAFVDAGFAVEDTKPLPGTSRVLALLRRTRA
jgi:hypothetical protein